MRLNALVPALSILITATASATTVLSNSGNTSSGAASMSASSTMFMMPGPGGFPMMFMTSNGSVVANSFTTSNDPLPLGAVTLLLGNSTGGGMSFMVSLYSDSLGAPGAMLTGLSGNSVPSAAGEYAYTAGTGGYALAANTTYWLRVELSTPIFNNSAIVPWSETADLSESSPDGWAMGTKLSQSVNNGTAGAWTADPTRSMMFSVSVVPEPAGAALVLLSGGGLLLRRRRALGA